MAVERIFVNGRKVLVVAPLLEDLVSRRLVMWYRVHGMPQLGKSPVHPVASTALIAQRTMLGNAVPRIVGKLLVELHLGRRVEFLSRDAQRRDRDPWAKAFPARVPPLFSIGIRCESVCNCRRMSNSTSPSARVAAIARADSRPAVGKAAAELAFVSSVFGHTEYCIAWPSPNRYGTQLKYGASSGLL